MSDDKIGQRLREFAKKRGGPATLAREIGISRQSLSNYFSGRSKPGNRMQERLRTLGCSISWLMYGDEPEETEKNFEVMMELQARTRYPEHFKIIEYLRSIGISTAGELKKLLTPALANALRDAAEQSKKKK